MGSLYSGHLKELFGLPRHSPHGAVHSSYNGTLLFFIRVLSEGYKLFSQGRHQNLDSNDQIRSSPSYLRNSMNIIKGLVANGWVLTGESIVCDSLCNMIIIYPCKKNESFTISYSVRGDENLWHWLVRAVLTGFKFSLSSIVDIPLFLYCYITPFLPSSVCIQMSHSWIVNLLS